MYYALSLLYLTELSQYYQVGAVIIPISQMMKLKLKLNK